MISTDVRVALSPQATHADLLSRDTRVTWWQPLGRAALALLTIAVAIPEMGLHRITVNLVLTVAASWSLAVVVQTVMALLLIVSAPARRVSVVRALDLWFTGHLPYNVWILALPVITLATVHTLDAILVTAVAPLVWSAFVISAYCRTVLGASPAQARRRTALHQAVVVALLVTMVLWDSGGMDAAVSYIARWTP